MEEDESLGIEIYIYMYMYIHVRFLSLGNLSKLGSESSALIHLEPSELIVRDSAVSFTYLSVSLFDSPPAEPINVRLLSLNLPDSKKIHGRNSAHKSAD